MDKKIPYSGGPKRLAFHIRKFRTYGSTSLLISNRFGVWSTVRCRHVKKTRFLRFHKLKDEARELEKLYVSLRELGVNDEQLTFWRRRLANVYWDALPAGHRVDAINYVRQVKWKVRVLRFVLYVVVAAVCATTILMSGPLNTWWALKTWWGRFGNTFLGVVVIYTYVFALCEVSDYADNVIVELLDQLACRREKRSVKTYRSIGVSKRRIRPL